MIGMSMQGLDPLGGRHSVDLPVQHDVHQHQVGCLLFRLPDGLFPGERRIGGGIAQAGQPLLHVHGFDAFVLHDQDLGLRHGVSLLLCLHGLENDGEFGSAAVVDVDFAPQLPDQHAHQFQSQGPAGLDLEALRQARPVVADGQQEAVAGLGAQADADLTRAAAAQGGGREGVLERVGDQLIDDQGAGDDRVDVEGDILHGDLQPDGVLVHPVRGEQVGGEAAQVFGQVDLRQGLGLVQLLMDEGHRVDAVLALLEQRDGLRVPDGRQLQVEHAVDDLEVVLDAMVDLLQQRLFLPQGALDLVLGPLHLPDVHGVRHESADAPLPVAIRDVGRLDPPRLAFAEGHLALVRDPLSGQRPFLVRPDGLPVGLAQDLPHVPPAGLVGADAEPALVGPVDAPVPVLGIDVGDQGRHRIRDQPQLALPVAQRLLGLFLLLEKDRVLQGDGRLGGQQFRHLRLFRGEHRVRQAVLQVQYPDHLRLLDHRQTEDGTQLHAPGPPDCP